MAEVRPFLTKEPAVVVEKIGATHRLSLQGMPGVINPDIEITDLPRAMQYAMGLVHQHRVTLILRGLYRV